MTFLAPGYLWLALLLIVPLILYLLPLPRRRVTTAALYLWERFLENEPFGKASEKMRRTLGFALLAAIFACLVLAASELAAGRGAVSAKKVVVLLDVSASMNAAPQGSGATQSNLQRAKNAATELIDSLSGTTQIAVVETGQPLRTLAAMGSPRSEALRSIARIQPFDGPSQLPHTLDAAYAAWGSDHAAEVYVFTDRALSANPWAGRAHAWVAPAAGDNVAIIDLEAKRKDRNIAVHFTLANYCPTSRSLSGTLLANGEVRGSFRDVHLSAGQTAAQVITIEEPAESAIEVKIDDAKDSLPDDDAARAMVPSAQARSVAVVWPDQTEGAKTESKKRNEYVSAVLAALQTDGEVGPLTENGPDAATSPVTVYVNQFPEHWPAGGAIVLYPLRPGVMKLKGLHPETLTASRQADNPLLADVDLRGLSVKDVVESEIPPWARALVWAGDTPLAWAGQTGTTRVLFVGIPILPSGSRLPLVASFPVLLRNAFQWMLPPAEILRPGESVDDWTSRRAAFVSDPAGKKHAFSVLSAEASDLRRPNAMATETFARRRPLAMPLVLLAMVLLAVEWGLFHRRLTE